MDGKLWIMMIILNKILILILIEVIIEYNNRKYNIVFN